MQLRNECTSLPNKLLDPQNGVFHSIQQQAEAGEMDKMRNNTNQARVVHNK